MTFYKQTNNYIIIYNGHFDTRTIGVDLNTFDVWVGLMWEYLWLSLDLYVIRNIIDGNRT